MRFFLRWMAGGGGALTFGRSKHKLYAQKDLRTTFQDVAGIDEAVAELREVVDFLKTPEKYQALGGRIPKGVMLVGPPGTGKTRHGFPGGGEERESTLNALLVEIDGFDSNRGVIIMAATNRP